MNTQEKMLKYHIKSVDFILDSVLAPKVSIKKPCPTCGQIIKDLEEEVIALRDKVRDLRHERDEALMAQDEPRHDNG